MMKLRSNVGVLLFYLLAAVLVVYSLSLVFLSNFNMGNLMVWLLTGCVTGYAVFRRPVNAWFSAGIGAWFLGCWRSWSAFIWLLLPLLLSAGIFTRLQGTSRS